MFRVVSTCIFFTFMFCKCDGGCPSIEPVPNLNVEGILGYWYTIQKSDYAVQCLTVNITKIDGKSDYYEFAETAPSASLVNMLGLQHEHTFKGKLHVKNPANPGLMDLSVLLRGFKFTVFATDYDSYVAFLLCKKGFALINNPLVIIASRTPHIDTKRLEPIYNKLLKYNINPFVIDTVNHQHCPEHGTKGVIINTASNIFDAVKHTVGGITNIFTPRGSSKHPATTTEAYDPRETGEYEIDIRAQI